MFAYVFLGNFGRDMANQKRFFSEFAESHNFDPLVADNWRSYTAADIASDRVIMIVIFIVLFINH